MTKQQEELLKDLLRNPVWLSLLDDLKASREVKPYKTGGDLREKQAQWIFESGIQRGANDVITELRLGRQ